MRRLTVYEYYHHQQLASYTRPMKNLKTQNCDLRSVQIIMMWLVRSEVVHNDTILYYSIGEFYLR